MEDKRNLFTAIGLSLLVLVGWQYFVTPRFVTPKPAQIETQQEGNPASTQQAATPQAVPQAPPPGTTAATPTSVDPGDFARGCAQILAARRHPQ